jgi:hypothetical protein
LEAQNLLNNQHDKKSLQRGRSIKKVKSSALGDGDSEVASSRLSSSISSQQEMMMEENEFDEN